VLWFDPSMVHIGQSDCGCVANRSDERDYLVSKRGGTIGVGRRAALEADTRQRSKKFNLRQYQTW